VTPGLVLAIVVSGFFTGALARFAIPGPDPMPIWLTLAIGLTGSIVGAVVGKAISDDNAYVISVLSFAVAIALVASYRRFVQRRPLFGPEALAFPKTGIGIDQQRDRLRKLGVDPDRLAPDPQRVERLRLEAALSELHRAGLIDDDELAAKRAQLERESGTS
jgi:uncharacterized membrane protein YeaQ/YmgE (transglycosylase-associated protein family)